MEDCFDLFAACWDDLADPRSGNAGLHDFHDFHELLMIALCAVLCGGQGAVDMARFAQEKEEFELCRNLGDGVIRRRSVLACR